MSKRLTIALSALPAGPGSSDLYWDDAGNNLTIGSGSSDDWSNARTTVNTNSATWNASADLSEVAAASGDWSDARTTVNTYSANWQSEVLGISVSDETSDIATGTPITTFRMPYAMTLTEVRANVNTAPVGSTIIVDINEGGSTILSTKLTIDASAETSTTAATPAVISDAALADDAEITIDIDQVGSGTAGTGLKLWLIGRRA